jgi:L-seryl-tRNA(Ser) seleniumtransferase
MVGKRNLIVRINGNHLQRALRCGKLTLAALEATLRLYRQSPDITQAIPTLKAFVRPVDEIHAMGEQILPKLQSRLGAGFRVSLNDSTSQIGSGALPTEELPTVVLAIEHASLSATRIAEQFRAAAPPIIGRISDGRFILDLRAVFDPRDLIPNFADEERKSDNFHVG